MTVLIHIRTGISKKGLASDILSYLKKTAIYIWINRSKSEQQ